ncbi:phenylacetate-CoA ligase [Pseudomonas sp. NFACC23-1]|uniref:phenylacetate--CoA ligase family protein n=1 Tax=unclassified Pseudomonas TaxID=196821 RepID=UPI0008824A0F|nr:MULTISPECIES: phenylacetate--CoA ligase family protein [unclassified Pseudomonas]SDB37439.1 phenylacetate-CoA ligase [Pseudomonas sp. NFACC17-2]SEJ54521.1 phenylacetate-CoA ligase [Pseudomonas sp. NFACC23-1]SFW71902.1 phenylacetate-CoA ligase [Pseudomonas sp. NFACC16-2]
MVNIVTTEENYDWKREHGILTTIKQMANQVPVRDTDNQMLQGKALALWSKNAEQMNIFLRQSVEDIRKSQLLKIKKLVDNAYTSVPFYRELYTACGYELGSISSFADFERLPIINKTLLNSFEPSKIVNDAEHLERANTSRTSGSSGNPFTVYSDDNDIILDHLQVLRFYNSCLKTPLQESDWIYLLHHVGLAFSSLHGKYRTFQLPDLLSDTPLGEHLSYLRPRLLVTLPSYLPLILQHKEHVKSSGVEAILTNSESSTQQERDYYSKALGLPVYDEYSSEEIGMIATQCTHGNYHVIEDGVYLEIVNADNRGFGNVVCTDLNNELMPLIRFDHGDVAKKNTSNSLCECGSACTSLEEINGRRDDTFRTRGLEVVPSASLLAAIDDILITPDKTLKHFRLLQKNSETVELITQYSGAPHKSMPKILQELRDRISLLFGYSITLLHREVHEWPMQKSYKRRSIVREWKLN